jgi:hypothetical protein
LYSIVFDIAIIFTEKNKNMITVSQLKYEVSLGLDRRSKTPETETQNFKTKKYQTIIGLRVF